jgi:hypothetical protein
MLSKIQDFLVPAFLKRLDFWLLTYKPHIWRTKGHFVLFYGTIAAIFFFIMGLIYPYTLFDLQGRYSHSTDVEFSFTVMSFFLVLGGVFLWWFSIQKYAYKRTDVKHFFIEIGIYGVGLFTLWTVFWAFTLGFDYKKCFLLEKNKIEDKEWFNTQSFPEFGYMPHVDPNKLLDLNKYFANGEKLIAIQCQREENTRSHRVLSNDKLYSFIDADFQSKLGSLDWEFKTLTNKTILPPQYKKLSDYVNVLIGNDSIRIPIVDALKRAYQDEETQANFDENYERLFDKIITGLDYNSLVELTENTYPRFYHHINYSSESASFLNSQMQDWSDQRAFLESLNPQELATYKKYLTDLFEDYKSYHNEINSINQLQSIVCQKFISQMAVNTKALLGISEYENYPPSPDDVYIANHDKNALAAEKLKKIIALFDLDSQKKYVEWLRKIDGTKPYRISNPINNQMLDNAYSTLKANSLDSLMLYDYYHLGIKNYNSYRAFFTNAYTDYAVKKRTAQDFDRLHNLLAVNGFPDETPQYKNSKLQKIALLFYSEKYRKANQDLENQRHRVKEMQAYLWSPFSLLYCLLGAIVFYVITLSTGIQFWASSFISGLYWALMLFLSQLFRWGHGSNSLSLPFNFMLVHIVLFVILIVFLLKDKVQWQRAHWIVNAVLLSGLGSVLAAAIYWESRIRDLYYHSESHNTMQTVDTIRVISNVLLVAILFYGVIAWLFKRHLTYPKKR